jgi:hypothetical protein
LTLRAAGRENVAVGSGLGGDSLYAGIPMQGNKPRIFISSTIHDLKDLRSALAYWLEEFGFDVILSDQNDFPQKPVMNSYH